MAKLCKRKKPKQARRFKVADPGEAYSALDAEKIAKRKATRKAAKRKAFAKLVAAEVVKRMQNTIL